MPWIYVGDDEERGRTVGDRVNAECNRLERAMGVKCTAHMRALVSNSVSAIREDPSPLWAADARAIDREFGRTLDKLRDLLEGLASQQRVDGVVSYFQALHWVGTNLDSICPFEKDRMKTRDR